MGTKGMQCEYRATHEFGADGCCNLCFKARLVAEREELPDEPLAPPLVTVSESANVPTQPMTVPSIWSLGPMPEPTTGWSYVTSYVKTTGNTRLMPMQELSGLQVQQAYHRVAGNAQQVAALQPRIDELQRQYYPYTKTGLLEEAAKDAQRAFIAEKQRVCDHRAVQLSADGYEADCSLCGKYFDEVELDNLQAERAHLETVQLKASAKVAALLLPALAKELAKAPGCEHTIGPQSFNSDSLTCAGCGKTWGFMDVMAAATEPDSETVGCECGWKGALGQFIKHRQGHRMGK